MSLLYERIREINPDLLKMDSVPLTAAPPFAWDQLSERLSHVFKNTTFTISSSSPEMREASKLTSDLGSHQHIISVSLQPLQGPAFWVMSDQAFQTIKSQLLSKDDQLIQWSDKTLDDSFLRFIALEILYHFGELTKVPSLMPILNNEPTLPNENALCFDITLQMNSHTLIGRLIVSEELRGAWLTHLQQSGIGKINESLAKKVEVALHVEAGTTQLNHDQWSHVKEGDFILLDHCSLEGEEFFGRVMLTTNGRPIFRAKLKEGKIKILELPVYHEVQLPMENEKEDEFDFDKELNLEDSIPEKEPTGEHETHPEGLESPSTGDEETHENPIEKTVALKEKSTPISPKEIPVSLVVELGRIQMTVGKLLELEPGNVLEVDIKPEQGVDLVINGKVVGKGELIRLGEALGVRIVELG